MMFKFQSKWKSVLGEGGRTAETIRFTQSHKKPCSHTVFSVPLYGMDDLQGSTPLCPTQPTGI